MKVSLASKPRIALRVWVASPHPLNIASACAMVAWCGICPAMVVHARLPCLLRSCVVTAPGSTLLRWCEKVVVCATPSPLNSPSIKPNTRLGNYFLQKDKLDIAQFRTPPEGVEDLQHLVC